MSEWNGAQRGDPRARFLALGLALNYFGKQELVSSTLEVLKLIEGPLGKIATLLLTMCSYAGSGNVLKIQQMLHICSEHFDTERSEDNSHQAFAVIAIGMIAMGEEIGSDMAMRTFSYLLQYGEPVIRRAVPLAISLMFVSNPKVAVLDTLGKLSHDSDGDVAHNSIFAMGIVGAGTCAQPRALRRPVCVAPRRVLTERSPSQAPIMRASPACFGRWHRFTTRTPAFCSWFALLRAFSIWERAR